MRPADVLTVVDVLTGIGVDCWLDGGWGVDAMVGQWARAHEDLDLVVGAADVPAAIDALEREGFAIDQDLRPCSFTMCTAGGRKVDIHPVTWEPDGEGVQALKDGSTWTYPAPGFGGVGYVAGRPVKCLTAEVQILCRDGYELDAGDLRDLQALRSTLAEESAEVRARWRDLVRQGFDLVSTSDRDDHGDPAAADHAEDYRAWVDELHRLLRPGARVLDLGCGDGLPGTKALVEAGFDVVGLDISGGQIERARELVPGAEFMQADMATWDCEEGSLDAVVSFYALIHVPLEDQRRLLPRIRRWLRPGGLFLAIVGHSRWTGLETYLGVPMFWDHADESSYLGWLSQAGLESVRESFVPEGKGGHTLVLASASG